MDDAWSNQLGKKDLTELKKSVFDSLQKEKEAKEEERLEAELVSEIAKQAETELPESLVLTEIQRLIQNLAHQVESKGLKWQQYLQNLKKEEKDIIADLRQPAEQNVKFSLVLNEIKKQEKTEISDSELEEEIKKLEAQKITVKDEDRERIKHTLAIKKTIDKLKKELIK